MSSVRYHSFNETGTLFVLNMSHYKVISCFQGFTASQTQQVADNTMIVVEREREITQIVRSIHDLNEIFKDLAVMIVDQVRMDCITNESLL